jgi:hypothetical protein
MESCVANLNSIGIFLGTCSNSIKVPYNALKHIQIDREKVQPKAGSAVCELNPFDVSDEEDPEIENGLLSHLVRDLTDVDLDDLDLDTRICDLKVSGRKSKSSSRKHKARRKSQKNSSVSP